MGALQLAHDVAFRRARGALAVLAWLTAPTTCYGVDSTPAGCQWPSCAGECSTCLQTTGGSTCYISVPGFAACPPYQECNLGTCSCAQRMCMDNGMCAPMRCTDGTRPPKFVPNEWVERLAQFGPASPPTGSSLLVWQLHSTLNLGAPIVIVGLGVAAAWATNLLLVKGPETCLCRRVPRVPVFLTVWALITLVYTASGSGQRQATIQHVFTEANAELASLKGDLQTILRQSHNISDTEEEFHMAIDQVPNSCAFKQVTQGFIVQLVNSVDSATEESFLLVNRLNDMFYTLPKEIGDVLYDSHLVAFALGYLPMVPMLIQMMGIVAIMVFACMSYFNPNPEIAERANRALTNYGAYVFPALIMMSALLAAVYLQTGIVISKFCLNVDANVLGIVKTMNFTFNGQLDNDRAQITADIHGTAEFYVSGIAPNPAQKIIEELATEIQTFSIVRNATKLMTKIGGYVCPYVEKLNLDGTISTLQGDIQSMRELIRPENIWPYYNTVVHDIACSQFPYHCWELTWLNAMMGLILLPVLAVTADIDLKRMVTYKRSQSWSQLDEEEEASEESSYEQSLEPPPMSAPTYTHVSKTVYPEHSHGRVHKKTFLA